MSTQCWSLVDGWKHFRGIYCFRAEVILYLLHTRIHHHAKLIKVAHGYASSSYSGCVLGSNLGLDIECSEGVCGFLHSLRANARTVSHVGQWLLSSDDAADWKKGNSNFLLSASFSSLNDLERLLGPSLPPFLYASGVKRPVE